MLTRQAGGYLEKKKREMGEKRDCARGASHHIQPIRQIRLENLITIFRKGFSSIEEPPLILKCQLFM